MSSINPDIVPVVVWAGQLYLIIISAVTLIGAVVIIGLFYTAITNKRIAANEARIHELADIVDTYTHTQAQTPASQAEKLDGRE